MLETKPSRTGSLIDSAFVGRKCVIRGILFTAPPSRLGAVINQMINLKSSWQKLKNLLVTVTALVMRQEA